MLEKVRQGMKDQKIAELATREARNSVLVAPGYTLHHTMQLMNGQIGPEPQGPAFFVHRGTAMGKEQASRCGSRAR